MAYKVLYRKYRPQTFSDVVGQDRVTVTLRNELVVGRIAHAYLFTGSRGTGKTSCAKILAKAVNCLSPNHGDPCGKCENCIGIDNGSIMDVMEIDAASNNRVDDVRTLIEEVAFTPACAKYRVYIIDEVHELSASAFNALLKTLEEPPAHVIFILATTEVHKLLTTILSRCQRFDFRRITPLDIAGRLEYICSLENATIEHEAALMIARIADGGMRDAISILDQCIGRSQNITCQVVEDTAGIVGKDHLFVLSDAVINNDSLTALECISSLHQNSKDLSKLCQELISHFRNLMLIKSMGNKAELIQMSDNEIEQLTSQALAMSLSAILHCLDVLQISLDKMRYSNQRIELEMAMIKLCTPELDSSFDSLIRRIESLEQRKVVASSYTPAVKERTAPPPSQSPSTAKSSNPLSPSELSKTASPFKNWQEVVHSIKSYSMTIGTAFASSSAYVSGDYILVDGSKIAFEYLRTKPDFKEKIKEALFNLTGKNYRLGPYVKPTGDDNLDLSNPLDAIAQKAKDAGIDVKTTE